MKPMPRSSRGHMERDSPGRDSANVILFNRYGRSLVIAELRITFDGNPAIIAAQVKKVEEVLTVLKMISRSGVARGVAEIGEMMQ